MSVERFARREMLSLGAAPATRVNIPPSPGLINLGTGDPDFNQPGFIADAVQRAILEGNTHYVFGGDPEFKRAIAEYYRKFGIDVDPERQVVVTSGGGPALFQAFAALVNPGDELIFLDPAYQGYNQPVAYFGARMVRANMTRDEDGLFRPDVENIRGAVTERTKGLLICNPDNPAGCVYTREELEGIAEVAVEEDILVFVDEIYTEFIWGGRRYLPLIGLPGMLERTVVLASFSKTFAWTGCRVGYIIAGPELAGLIDKVPLGTCTVPVAFQKAGIEVLRRGWGFVEEMRRAYAERIDHCLGRLNEIPGVRCPRPEGAFYLFPDISELGIPTPRFCDGLFKEERLRVMPGTTFGANSPGHIRLAVVAPMRDLKEAMDRFERHAKRYG